MKSILFILDHPLHHYRVPFFERLAQKGYSISIIHLGKVVKSKHFKSYSTVYLFKRLGFFYVKEPVDARNFDCVVIMQNIRLINIWKLTFNPFFKIPIVHWGIGVSSASGLSFNRTFTSRIRNFLASFSAAQVLYSKFPIQLFSENVHKKTFIAENTVYNEFAQDFSVFDKYHLLFIGTLNERKGIIELIEIFNKYLRTNKNKRINKLVIIGDGPLFKQCLETIESLDLKNNVILTGSIFLAKEKLEYFKNAAISVSLNQAGLSVLESFSFGVPFVTKKAAISGGEHLNIIDGYNGFLIKDEVSLIRVLNKIDTNPDLVKLMGKNAFLYYTEKRNIDIMLNGFIDCFKHVGAYEK
ncbi:MAG: glycosyltransferase family 4 protein [Fulvivirga sp.]